MAKMNLKDRFEKATETKRNLKRPLNLTVRIDKYHVDSDEKKEQSVECTVIDDKSPLYQQSITIKLTDEEVNQNQYKLSDFANADPENSAHVWSAEQGLNKKAGIMVFEQCHLQSDGTYTARFSHPMIYDTSADRQKVSSGYCTAVFRAGTHDERTNETKPNIAFLRQAEVSKAKAFAFNQKSEMFEYLKESMLVKSGDGAYRPEAIVRFVDAQGQTANATILTAPYIRPEDENEMPRLATPDESIASFVEELPDDQIKQSNMFFQIILDAIDENKDADISEAFVEVIPVARRAIRTTSTTQDSLFSLKTVETKNPQAPEKVVNALSKYGETLLSRFIKRVENEPSTRLWVPTTFNTIQTKPDGDGNTVDYRFIGEIVTKDPFPSGYEIDNIPTANFTNVNLIKAVFGSDDIAVKRANAAMGINSNPAPTPAPQQAEPQTQPKPTTAKASETVHAGKPDLSDDFEEIVDALPSVSEQVTQKQEPVVAATQTAPQQTSDQDVLNELLEEMHSDGLDDFHDTAIYSESSLDSAMQNGEFDEETQFDEDEQALMDELFAQNNLGMR